jgi:hypothetical protein
MAYGASGPGVHIGSPGNTQGLLIITFKFKIHRFQ